MNMDKEETCRWGDKGQGPWGPLFLSLDKKKLISRDRNLTKIMSKVDFLHLKFAFNNWGLNGRQSIQGYKYIKMITITRKFIGTFSFYTFEQPWWSFSSRFKGQSI